MLKKTPVLKATVSGEDITLTGDEAMGLLLQLETLDLSGNLQTQVQYVDPTTQKIVRKIYGCCGDKWSYKIEVEEVDAIPCKPIDCYPYIKGV